MLASAGTGDCGCYRSLAPYIGAEVLLRPARLPVWSACMHGSAWFGHIKDITPCTHPGWPNLGYPPLPPCVVISGLFLPPIFLYIPLSCVVISTIPRVKYIPGGICNTVIQRATTLQFSTFNRIRMPGSRMRDHVTVVNQSPCHHVNIVAQPPCHQSPQPPSPSSNRVPHPHPRAGSPHSEHHLASPSHLSIHVNNPYLPLRG